MDRYGEEVEYDLHHFLGLDLLDFFRGRYSWRKLHGLMQKLPSTSLTKESMAQDDELARQFAGAVEDHKDTGPRLAEYTLEAQRLDTVTDLLQAVLAALIDMGGGRSGRVRPAKRPETAFTRLRDLQARSRHNSLLDEVATAQERWSAKHN